MPDTLDRLEEHIVGRDTGRDSTVAIFVRDAVALLAVVRAAMALDSYERGGRPTAEKKARPESARELRLALRAALAPFRDPPDRPDP